MGFKDQYIISFSGLALGRHEFEYIIDHTFFDSFEYSEIHDGILHILVEMDRQENMLVFHFSIQGSVSIPCDRCLDPFDLPVDSREVLFVKFGDDFHEESAEIIFIPRTEHRFDLRAILYEMIMLSIPYQRIHPNDEQGNSSCNPEILKKLKELEPDNDTDPRWEGLKGINLEN